MLKTHTPWRLTCQLRALPFFIPKKDTSGQLWILPLFTPIKRQIENVYCFEGLMSRRSRSRFIHNHTNTHTHSHTNTHTRSYINIQCRAATHKQTNTLTHKHTLTVSCMHMMQSILKNEPCYSRFIPNDASSRVARGQGTSRGFRRGLRKQSNASSTTILMDDNPRLSLRIWLLCLCQL